MQARLQKIQEWVTRLADKESSVMADINFLLDALGQAQDKIKSLEFDLKNKTHLNAIAIHIIEKQKDTMLKITEIYTDESGKVWEVPTSWAYAQACKALHKHTEQERVLRNALNNIYLSTAKDAGLTMYEVTKIYCCARDALGQENKSPSNAKIEANFTGQEVANGNN